MGTDKMDRELEYNDTISELLQLESMLDLYLGKLNKPKPSDSEGFINGQVGILDSKLAEEMSEKLKLLEEKTALLDSISDLTEQMKEVDAKLGMLEDMDEDIRLVRNIVDEKLNIDFVAMYNNILDQMNIEAIKIYRNIQAVIVEENAKQNNVLFRMDKNTDGLRRRMNHVLFFCIVSFIVSIALIILQILPAFGIKLF